MGDLELDTRLTAVGGDPGHYTVDLSSDWEIWGPNGGYLGAIALRAAGLEASIARPVAFNAHFLSVARFDRADVRIRVVRRGRRAESLAVSLSQGDKPVIEAMVRTAGEGAGLEHDHSTAPSVTAPEMLRNAAELSDDDRPVHPFWHNLETRPLAPERFSEPPRARDPERLDWYRFQPRATFEDPFLDAARSLVLIDTLSWPAAVQPHPETGFTAPNLDVTAWFHRAAPESEWLLADHRCELAESGLMGTHARIWSRDGRLVATGGAMLLCVPPREA